MTTEEQLAWEARERPRAAVGAIAAGVLTLGGGVAAALAYRGFPKDSPGAPVLRALFYHDHASELLLASAVLALGPIGIAVALSYLYRATRHRHAGLAPVARFTALFGAASLTVSTIAQQVLLNRNAADFVDGAQTYIAAKAVTQSDGIIAMAIVRQAGVLALGFAFVMICLNAMRIGLLTRFMGILGMIAGVLLVIPIGSPLPIVQSFWLIALGALFAGRWPNGVPPAWASGKAEPWPTQLQAREQREAAAGRAPAPASEPVVAGPSGAAHPASRKRKRKRRS